jgi:hypothetical protein
MEWFERSNGVVWEETHSPLDEAPTPHLNRWRGRIGRRGACWGGCRGSRWWTPRGQSVCWHTATPRPGCSSCTSSCCGALSPVCLPQPRQRAQPRCAAAQRARAQPLGCRELPSELFASRSELTQARTLDLQVRRVAALWGTRWSRIGDVETLRREVDVAHLGPVGAEGGGPAAATEAKKQR